MGLVKSCGQKLRRVYNGFIKTFQDDESKFRFITAWKITLIPLFSFAVMFLLLFLFLKLNVLFFSTFEQFESMQLHELFLEYTLKNAVDYLPLFSLMLVLQYFVGLYIANLLLRPFVAIGKYAEQVVEGRTDASYDPDFFTDLKLLTRFAEYFFNWMENFQRNTEVKPVKLPKKYTRIHKPVFEKEFFIHYSFFIITSSLIFGAINYLIILGIQENIIDFAGKTLPLSSGINNFLIKQSTLLYDILLGVVVAHVLMNLILTVNLYFKVSGPAFGVFSTMRAFIKGNHRARVHLIGYYYVRKQCRKLNKYLDFLSNEYME